MGDDDTMVVASERSTMVSERTASGARAVPMVGGRGSGIGWSAMVEVRFCDEWMRRREVVARHGRSLRMEMEAGEESMMV